MEEVLVVGSDATARALLCSAFERQGLRARSAPDGVAALGLCQRLSPSALVAEPGLEGLDAFALLTALRQSNRFAKIPFLLLGGDEEDRFRALAEGADAVLPLPIFGRDVVSLTRFLIAKTPDGSLFLEEYGVLSFIRALCSARVEAQLSVRRSPSARLGEAHLSIQPEGVSVRLGHLKGRAALHRLAIWRHAHVTWHTGIAVPLQRDEEAEEEAFLDAARYLAEVKSLLMTLPPEDLPLSLVAEKAPRPDTLPGEVRTILTLCEGGLSIGELLEEVPFRIVDSLRILRRLFELEILRRPTLPQPLPSSSLREGKKDAGAPVIARRIVIIEAEEEPETEATRDAAQTWPPGPVPAVLASAPLPPAPENLEERIAEVLAEEELTEPEDDPFVEEASPFGEEGPDLPGAEAEALLFEEEEGEYIPGASGDVDLLDDEDVVSYIGAPPGEEAPREAPPLAQGQKLGYALSVDGEEGSLVIEETTREDDLPSADFVASPLEEDDARFDTRDLDFSPSDTKLTPEILKLNEEFLPKNPEETPVKPTPSHQRRRWRFWRRGSRH